MSDEWYYALGGAEYGPVAVDQLAQLAASGELKPTGIAWRKASGRGQPRPNTVIANLVASRSEATEQRLVSATVGKGTSGVGFSTGHWPDDCAAQQESMYWSWAALMTRTVLDHPDDPDQLFALAARYFDLGLLYQGGGRFGEAEWAYNEALAVRERLARAWPQKFDYQQGLAASYNQLGLLSQDCGALTEAEALIEKAVVIRSQLLRAHPTDAKAAVPLGGALCNLGNVLSDQGRYSEALDRYEQAIPLIESQLAGLRQSGIAAVWSWLFRRKWSDSRALLSMAQAYLANTRAGRARVLEQLSQ